jgi:hypothetical protein
MHFLNNRKRKYVYCIIMWRIDDAVIKKLIEIISPRVIFAFAFEKRSGIFNS